MILNILLFSFLFDWYYKMVPPQNGDTRGGPPPPSDATVSKYVLLVISRYTNMPYLL